MSSCCSSWKFLTSGLDIGCRMGVFCTSMWAIGGGRRLLSPRWLALLFESGWRRQEKGSLTASSPCTPAAESEPASERSFSGEGTGEGRGGRSRRCGTNRLRCVNSCFHSVQLDVHDYYTLSIKVSMHFHSTQSTCTTLSALSINLSSLAFNTCELVDCQPLSLVSAPRPTWAPPRPLDPAEPRRAYVASQSGLVSESSECPAHIIDIF